MTFIVSLDLFVCRKGVQAKRALVQLNIMKIKIIHVNSDNALLAFPEKLGRPGQLGQPGQLD